MFLTISPPTSTKTFKVLTHALSSSLRAVSSKKFGCHHGNFWSWLSWSEALWSIVPTLQIVKPRYPCSYPRSLPNVLWVRPTKSSSTRWIICLNHPNSFVSYGHHLDDAAAANLMAKCISRRYYHTKNAILLFKLTTNRLSRTVGLIFYFHSQTLLETTAFQFKFSKLVVFKWQFYAYGNICLQLYLHTLKAILNKLT